MSGAIGSSIVDGGACVDGRPRSQSILVTGAPRSGTTWAGSTIAAAARLRYVHEPFNPHYYRPALCSVRFGFLGDVWVVDSCLQTTGDVAGIFISIHRT